MAHDPDNGRRHASTNGASPDIGDLMDRVSDDAKGWVKAQKDYNLLMVSERFGRMSGSLTAVILLALFCAGALLMGSVALGLFLGEIWGSMPLGFLGICGAYIAIAVLFYLIGQKPVKDMITLTIINASREEDPVS